MQTKSTTHPYHSIAKSNAQQYQPFLKSICYYIRIEERKKERKRRKEGKNKHNIQSYFLQTNPKSRLFQKVKEVPTNGIPKIRRCLKRIFLNSRNTELFLYRCRFMEFQLQGVFEYFANLLNSKNRHYFQIVRLLEFLFKLLIQARNDVWSVEQKRFEGKSEKSKFKSLFSSHPKLSL